VPVGGACFHQLLGSLGSWGSRTSELIDHHAEDDKPDQQVHEETEWIYIVLWNKENLAAYLIKGTKVYVEGRIQTRSYEDDGGVKRYVTEVVAQNIVLLGSSGNVNGNGLERAEKSA